MKKQTIVALILIMVMIILSGCGSQSPKDSGQKTSNSNEAKRKIIIDTDTAADDASAIILAAMDPSVEILGITVNVGNVDMDQAVANAQTALKIAGRKVAIYRGSEDSYLGEKKEAVSVYGTDGMGDQDLVPRSGESEEQDGVDFILQSIRENPGEVEIVALGPVTNIAKAIDREPETMKMVKRIWSMGTAGQGAGNASPVAEFNVYGDVPAYQRMVSSGLPITIIGLDMTDEGDAPWTDANFKELRKQGKVGKFIATSFIKLRVLYEANGGGDKVDNCDGMAMMAALDEDFVTDTIQCHASCITEPGETYGQVIFYQKGFIYDITDTSDLEDEDFNITLVHEVQADQYFNKYLERIS